MKNIQLENTLINISKDVRNFFGNKTIYINRGGCVFFAKLVAKELYKRNIDYYYSVVSRQKCSENDYIEAGNNGLNYYIDNVHALINIENKLYDSTGFTNLKLIHEYYNSKYNLNIKLNPIQIGNIYKNNDWNPVFNIEFNNIDKIELKNIIIYNFTTYDEITNSFRH